MKNLLTLTVVVASLVSVSGFYASAASVDTKSYTCAQLLKKHGPVLPHTRDAQGKVKVQLDTISCHADTGYQNDHDYAGKDLTKGDAS